MVNRYFIILFVLLYNVCSIQGRTSLETYCNINGKYPLQHISEKFLSLSIEPEVLAKLNLSDTSRLLAQHLSPAYIRVVGPSAPIARYIDNEDKSEDSLSRNGNVVVTPSMWFGINEWLKLANLTPVFGINHAEAARGVWNPKSTSPLLEISDKLNVSCYWMLGFDTSNRNEPQYKENLKKFHNVLTSFEEGNDTWKIGGDFSMDNKKFVFDNLKNIATDVTWDLNSNEESLPKKEPNLNDAKVPVKFWTVSPKPEPVSFFSTLLWAQQVGNAAKMGYDVVFRKSRLNDVFSPTPAYWFSLLHKELIGKTVLEAKLATNHSGSSVFAHCTKERKDFKGKGSLTIMVVNSNLESYKVKVQLEQTPWSRFMEVHSYILTTSDQNSNEIFLNGKQLTPSILLDKDPFQPNVRIAKTKTYVSLKVPPMSIGFFVLPKAKVPVCFDEEGERIFVPQESNTVDDFETEPVTLQSRDSFNRNLPLEEFRRKIRKDYELDRKYLTPDLRSRLDALKQRIQSDRATESPIESLRQQDDLNETKLKNDYKEQKTLMERDELKKNLFGKYKTKKQGVKIEPRSKYLDLTSEETERILKDRARARAAQKRVFLTEDELDIIVEAVRRRFLNPKYKLPISSAEAEIQENGIIKKKPLKKRFRRSLRKPRDVNDKLLNFRAKIEENRQRLEERMSDVVGNAQTMRENIRERIKKLKYKNRYKRDINMELLKLKTEAQKKKAKDLMKKSKRKVKPKKSSWSSEELSELDDDDSSFEKHRPTMEFFQESANSEESGQESLDSSNKDKKHKKLSLLDKIKQLAPAKPKDQSKLKYKKDDSEEVENSLAFLTASDEFNDIGGELPCISEYFRPSKKSNERNHVGQSKRKLNGKVSKGKAHDSMEYLRRKRSAPVDENMEELNEAHYNKFDLVHKNFGKRSAVNCVEFQFENNKDEVLKQKRAKRDTQDETEDDTIPEEKHTPVHKMDIKQRLKDLLQAKEWEKLKFDKEMWKNKLKLYALENKKYQDQHQTGEKKEEIIEKLKTLKEKLTYKLNHINKMLTNDSKLRNKLEEEKQNLANDLNIVEHESQNVYPSTKDTYSSSHINTINDNNQVSPPVKIVKRSLFDQICDDFGNYKPITPDLRAWKPSDILSLRKSIDFGTSPINDYLMFKNVIIPNKFVNSRRKRKIIENSLDYLDRDSYMNDIEKDSAYGVPKTETGKDTLTIVAQDVSVKLPSDAIEPGMVGKTSNPTDTRVTVDDNTREMDVANPRPDGIVTVITRLSDNIQKIPTKEEQAIVDSFINKISGFFTNMGVALKHYL